MSASPTLRWTHTLEYFEGKARLGAGPARIGFLLPSSGPAVLFGREDILVNNIAWMLRRFPAFGVFGDGQYRVQPIYVDDLARTGRGIRAAPREKTLSLTPSGQNVHLSRAGVEADRPDHRLRGGRSRPVSHRAVGYLGQDPIIGRLVGGTVFITREEIAGLMAEPAVRRLRSRPGHDEADRLGAQACRHRWAPTYASELARRR